MHALASSNAPNPGPAIVRACCYQRRVVREGDRVDAAYVTLERLQELAMSEMYLGLLRHSSFVDVLERSADLTCHG